MKKINKELKLGECQEHRIWLHSNTLGFGKWVSTIHLVSIIKRLSTSHNNDFKAHKSSPKVCPQCMSEKTIKCNEIGDRLCKDCGYTYEGKPS